MSVHETAPTVHVSSAGLALGIGLFAIFLVGDWLLPAWLGLDLDCLDRRSGRRGEFAGMLVCAAGSGRGGWLFLGWLAAPLALFGLWLRRALNRARGVR